MEFVPSLRNLSEVMNWLVLLCPFKNIWHLWNPQWAYIFVTKETNPRSVFNVQKYQCFCIYKTLAENHGKWMGRSNCPHLTTNVLTTYKGLMELNLYIVSIHSAYKQRSYTWGEERICMPMAGLFSRAETIQSPVYAGSPYEETHGRKATQMHCE